jgi:CheY-like chemotaxis protein
LADCRVLLVDDNAANRDFLSNRLRRLGLKVWIAESADAALEMLMTSGQEFDALVTDLMMPNVDGFDLARQIRAAPKMQHLKLILVSSLPLHLLPRKPEAELFDEVLSKPLSVQQLHDVLQPLIGRGQGCDLISPEEGQDVHPIESEHGEQTFAEKYPAKILVAEDNPANLELLINLLDRMGYSDTVITEDGRQCLDQWHAQKADILLLDVHMPKLNGLRVAEKIRQEEADSNSEKSTLLIALTADALHGDREKCLNAGMDDYLAKPFKQSDLEEVFLRHLAEDQQ